MFLLGWMFWEFDTSMFGFGFGFGVVQVLLPFLY